jgi:hypothetical protein
MYDPKQQQRRSSRRSSGAGDAAVCLLVPCRRDVSEPPHPHSSTAATPSNSQRTQPRATECAWIQQRRSGCRRRARRLCNRPRGGVRIEATTTPRWPRTATAPGGCRLPLSRSPGCLRGAAGPVGGFRFGPGSAPSRCRRRDYPVGDKRAVCPEPWFPRGAGRSLPPPGCSSGRKSGSVAAVAYLAE